MAENLDQFKQALADRYTIDREVGGGVYGIVFQGNDSYQRVVALKVIHPELVDAVGRDVLLSELRFVARLSHPHILPILDSGEAGGIVYYVTPYLTGESLRARIDRERLLPIEDVLQIVREVAGALAYAHSHNVLHRDINPANVFLESGHAVVKDFWIARALSPGGGSDDGLVTEIPRAIAYYAEQTIVPGADVGPAADVYSLGCLVYEMLSGAPPVTGGLLGPAVVQHVGKRVPPLQPIRPDVGPELSAAITKALAQRPADRFANPQEFVEACEAAPTAATARVTAKPSEVFRGRPMAAFPRWIILPAAIVLLLIVASSLMVFESRAPDVPAPEPGVPPAVWVGVALLASITAAVLVLFLIGRRTTPVTTSIRAVAIDPMDRIKKALRYRYEIVSELGRGGMAIVFLARDLKYPGREVALKVLRPELAASIESERFLREVEITAQLTHPLILPLFDSGDADGMPFYVMPYLQGESLKSRILREHRLTIDTAKEITRDVASALDYAHRKRVIHRDVKPENILLCEGQASVADFGVALAVDTARERITERGFSPGTPEYMSPEQLWEPENIDHRTDLYGLGCVLYEMLVGDPPYTGDPQAVATKHLNAPVPHVRFVRPDVTEDADAAICMALSKDKEQRFQSGAALVAALQ